jgi:hypothetical protein
MTNPRWLKVTWFRFVVGSGAVAVVAIVAWLIFGPDADQRAFRRIEPGMTREQVKDALCVPEDVEGKRKWGWDRLDRRDKYRREQWGEEDVESARLRLTEERWAMREYPSLYSTTYLLEKGEAHVVFDMNGRAEGAELRNYKQAHNESPVAVLRRLLGL